MVILIPPALELKKAIGYFEQNTAADRVISGLGFRPRVVFFFNGGAGGAQEIFSCGFDDGTSAMCIYKRGNEAYVGNSYTRSIISYQDATNYLMGWISSIGADGFTISFVLAGSTWVYCEWCALG